MIPYRRLLLNSMVKSNDSREYKKFMFAASYWPTNTIYDSKTQNEFNSKILREDCKSISFSTFYNVYLGFEYSNMWAHYGEKHKGICLRMNKKKFEKGNERILWSGSFKPITYYKLEDGFSHPEIRYPNSQSQEIFKDYLLNKFRYENLDFLYFMKREEWFSEHELRLIIFSKSKEKEFCSIKDSLNAIILGMDYSHKNDHLIYKYSKQIPIFKLDYNGDRIIEKEYEPTAGPLHFISDFLYKRRIYDK